MQDRSSSHIGREVSLISNYFAFKSLPVNTIYSYLIEYTPEVDINNKDLRKYLISNAKSSISPILAPYFYYDYIITTKLHEEPITVSAVGRDSTPYTLSIRFVSIIDPSSFHFCWYLNILIKLQQRALGLKQITNKPTFFNSDQAIDLKQIGLIIWNGYKASVNPVGPSTLMCMDICSKIINTKNVLEAIEEIRERDLETRKKKINDFLYNQIVMTMYNKRFYRVQRVDFDSNPHSTFMTKEGEISINEYYLKQYNIKIKDNRQPLLVAVQRGVELKVVPELCFLTGIPEQAKRNGNMMRQVRDANRSNPSDRFAAIVRHAERMGNEGRELAIQQGLLVDPSPLRVQAVELTPIRIQIKNETIDCSDRGFNIKSAIKSAEAIRLLRIYHTSNDFNNANKLEKSLKSRLSSAGVNVGSIDFDEYNSSNDLCQRIHALRGNPTAPRLLIIILQRRDKTYEDIKQLSITIEIPIQCMLSSQFHNERKVDSVLTNVAHQIAAKTGSQIWSIPHCEGIPKITMVVGMDVYHDTVNKKESILGFSASLNPEFTKYFSTIRKQAKIGEEISAAAEGCFHEALVAFFEETKRRFLPSLIVVFRDGVSDSQEDIVRNIEISGLRKVVSQFQGYEPKIVYVIVCKRIDQRFFLTSQGPAGNPRAGTCVLDPTVCDEATFYLITSAVHQGTVTPVKYKIILNTSDVTKETVARFAFGLCHLYFNWKGAIKLPAPTQLAHKLAYMVGECVHRDAQQNLKKSLWFL